MIQYYLNDKLFRDYGVHVEGSAGYFDILGRKSITTYSWPETNGHYADLSNTAKNERVITLYCWAVADSWSELMLNIRSVFGEFDKPGRQRLRVEIPFGNPERALPTRGDRLLTPGIGDANIRRPITDVVKPLIYEVYMPNEISVSKEIKDGRNFGFFKVQLVEPNPVKKIYRFKRSSISVVGEAEGFVEIFWGNGTNSKHRGAFDITKIYNELGLGEFGTEIQPMRYIVIAGASNDLGNINVRNAELVWSIL